jgi:hypothetical protein
MTYGGRVDQYDLGVIGGGPAGLFAAIHSSFPRRRILLIEKKNSCGNKLLIAGSGQCNITHDGDVRTFLSHYGQNGKFLKPALYEFSNQELIRYFNSQGIRTVTDDHGKIFPESRRSNDILDCLVLHAVKSGVAIRNNDPATAVFKDGDAFEITTAKRKYYAGSLVISTGGRSYPRTGSNGDGYIFSASLGHTIVPPAPALTPLTITSFPFADLAGISIPGMTYSLWRNKRKLATFRGDLLFTHTGLSGPGILDNSRWMQAGDEIRLSFIGSGNSSTISKDISLILEKGKNARLISVLGSYHIPARLLQRILEIIEIQPEITCCHLPVSGRRRLVTALTGLSLTIDALGDFSVAMVTRGGVDLKEVNAKTMESRLVKNLFFAGEILDIDGDSGGYNLQAAFSTGWIAARSIRNQWSLT